MVNIIKITTLHASTATARDVTPQNNLNIDTGNLLPTSVDKKIQAHPAGTDLNQQRSEKWVFQEGMDVRFVMSGDRIVEKSPPKFVLDRYEETQILQKKARENS